MSLMDLEKDKSLDKTIIFFLWIDVDWTLGLYFMNHIFRLRFIATYITLIMFTQENLLCLQQMLGQARIKISQIERDVSNIKKNKQAVFCL